MQLKWFCFFVPGLITLISIGCNENSNPTSVVDTPPVVGTWGYDTAATDGQGTISLILCGI